MVQKHVGTRWSPSFAAIKTRLITLLLAALVITLLAPVSTALATDETPATPISISKILGVTPPQEGATPVETITPTAEYTGTVSWSDSDGTLESGETFAGPRVYAAAITLTLEHGITYADPDEEFFPDVQGAFYVTFDDQAGIITAYFKPTAFDASDFLDETFGTDGSGSISLKDIFGPAPLNESGTAVGPVKVDRIAVDSEDRIVVLASFYGNDENNYILFRLMDDGSYDNTFATSGPYLRKQEDSPFRRYVLVTTTCNCYSLETVDLEITFNDQILVMLSGSVGTLFYSVYQNFIAHYKEDGTIDTSFGEEEEGVIGSLDPQFTLPPWLYKDFTVDSLGNIVVASLSDNDPEVMIQRFTKFGLIDPDFGDISEGDTGTVVVEIGSGPPFPEIINVQIIADNETPPGYLLAASGNMGESFSTYFIRLDEDGQRLIDDNGENLFTEEGIIDNFILTDVFPDGQGFILSGTFLQFVPSFLFYGAVIRINLDGTFDDLFNGQVDYLFDFPLSPNASVNCINSALLRNDGASQSEIGVLVGNYCPSGVEAEGNIKGFVPTTPYQSELLVGETTTPVLQVINQPEVTDSGTVLVLSGARPTKGFLPLYLGESNDWSNARISRYGLTPPPPPPPPTPAFTLTQSSETATVGVAITAPIYTITPTVGTFIEYEVVPSLPTGLTFETTTALIAGTPQVSTGLVTYKVSGFTNINETATATFRLTINAAAAPPTPPAPVVVYVAPKPVPYLQTISAPQLKLKEDKLVCSAGAYQTGNTLEGVIQPNSITPFTPIRYLFNLLVGGIAQSATAITSGTSSASWDLSTVPAGSVVSCSVTVSAGAITNTDKSTENTSGLSSALSAQRNSIAAAESAYGISLNANSKAYQKALVDNRAKWRSDVEKIRTYYYAERDRIKSLPSTRVTRALASAALKAYTAAQKKSATDYRASQPAALAERDAANKAALDAKTTAIAKANAAYGTFIESIGYGVLIP